LCGKVEENLTRVLIEGVELDVCSACSRFGKAVSAPKRFGKEDFLRYRAKQIQRQEPTEEKIELLLEDYADIIKRKRESMGLTQKDFAIKVNEKESVIHKIETSALYPPIWLAKKLEKALGIKLIEEHTEGHKLSKSKNSDGLTLGDFIKLKK